MIAHLNRIATGMSIMSFVLGIITLAYCWPDLGMVKWL